MRPLSPAARASPSDGAARMAQNALFKAASQATRLLSVVFVVVAARQLGPERFGKFTVAYAAAVLLGAALDLGVPAVLTRRVARAPAEARREWATAALVKLGLLGPVGLVYALLPVVGGSPADTRAAIWLVGLALVLQSFVELGAAVFAAQQAVRRELGVRLAEKLVLVGAGFLGLRLGGGLATVCAAFVLAGLVALALTVALLHRQAAPPPWRELPTRARTLVREVGLVSLAFVVAFATTRLVPLVVAFLAGERAAGYLGAATRVVDVLQVLPVTVTAAVYPVLARTGARDPRFLLLVRQTVAVLLLAALPVVLVLVLAAPWIVGVILGAEFRPTATLLAILGPAALLDVLQFFLGALLLALDRPARLLAAATAALMASLVLTPILVHAAGARGGALAVLAVSAVAVGGSMGALAPLVGWPVGAGAVKVVTAAALAALGGGLVPAPARAVVALGLYGAGVVALRPLPAGLGRRLFRGALGTVSPVPGSGGG